VNLLNFAREQEASSADRRRDEGLNVVARTLKNLMYIIAMIYMPAQSGAHMQVAKWGNSLAVRLPRSLVTRLGLKAGDEVTILSSEESTLVIEKAENRRAAIARMASRRWTAPRSFRFNRDDANTR
jgi:antitoxin MazE